MADYSLPAAELADLRSAHRGTRDKREAHRIKAAVLLASAWSAEDIAAALLIDPNTVWNHCKRYQEGGLPGLLHLAYCGSACELRGSRRSADDSGGWIG